MKKRSRWQLFLILAVIALTFYNILPTLFYYTKPLQSPISPKMAEEIAIRLNQRLEILEQDAKDWIFSFLKLIHVKPVSILQEGRNFSIRFETSEEALKFKKFFSRSGALIPFGPSQLVCLPSQEDSLEVIVQRKIPSTLPKEAISFAPKNSPLYQEVILDRATQIAFALTGPTESGRLALNPTPKNLEELAFQIQSITEFEKVNKTIANRYIHTFFQGLKIEKAALFKQLLGAFESLRDRSKKSADFEKKEPYLIQAEKFLKRYESLLVKEEPIVSFLEIEEQLQKSGRFDFGSKNPLFSSLTLDWDAGLISLTLHPEVNFSDWKGALINEAAKIKKTSNESFSLEEGSLSFPFHDLADGSSLLVIRLKDLALEEKQALLKTLTESWKPTHPDLQELLIVDQKSYQTLSPQAQALSLTIYEPTEEMPHFYILAKGLQHILQNYQDHPANDLAEIFQSDFRALLNLLKKHGFEGYSAQNQDLIFEKRDLYDSLLGATRENFQVKGSKKFAFLELSTLEQRLVCENQIDTKMHEDLLKWRDEYNAAQVSQRPLARFEIPKPVKNVFWNNLILSWKKLLRGDEKKVIRWGLDLSGGKTVQIELKDANNQIVTEENDIKQGINELYNRVNKMGVSEVAIRQLGHHIVLDFPGAQSFSASDLIKSSSMYFHVVNEKFSSPTSPFAAAASRFLQQVWNEALVSGQTHIEQIEQIAYEHLQSDHPSESAKVLIENGLTLQSPNDARIDSALNEKFTKIAMIRDDSWFGQTHPLLFVFRNFALEGSQLTAVHGSYDPQKGNYLSFEVASSSQKQNGEKMSPRKILKDWTSQFSKEKIFGTPNEEYTQGRGWRMAVILNDSVISAPTLDAVIEESASISGSFSQREVNLLVSDLRAGSLSYTPHILSEKNVSPELGAKERSQGILATFFALALVIGAMTVYYRFAGLVASIAVLFNLLILWAVLQNMGAALSLAGIAGIILTVGMAVDANVLVFERIKEEFAFSQNIQSAIEAGYQKAYSAIIDSNVTTIVAALILLNFDAGPIKGFAITLIIGIVSSMFTALFMTRFYFNHWVQNPKKRVLKMAHWISAQSINFLKYSKLAFATATLIILAGSYFVFAKNKTLFGMDFTGGSSIELELVKNDSIDFLSSVEEAFIEQGAAKGDFQMRALNPSNHLRILFGTTMDLEGKPFHKMPIALEDGTNPRIAWIQNALESHQIQILPKSLENSNWISMSGQMSDSMRNNALIGLLLAFVSIFIYLSLRFEYKFAAAALLCLIHDVLITVGMIGILHALGVSIQIDLNTIAAIMTIIGYSLNDTIIIFDRIREEMQTSRLSLHAIVNHSLNATLSRTTITSGTTLLVLIALVVLGGASIFNFALVMTMGVFFGTLSSWYIASPLMLIFHKREEAVDKLV